MTVPEGVRCNKCGCWYICDQIIGSLRSNGDRCGDLSANPDKACDGICLRDPTSPSQN